MTTKRRRDRFQVGDDELEVVVRARDVEEGRARVAAGEDPQAVAADIALRLTLEEEGIEPKTLAHKRGPETLVHKAANAHAPKLSVAFRYAFAMGRKAIAGQLRAAGFNPDQARDEQGQWTGDGSSSLTRGAIKDKTGNEYTVEWTNPTDEHGKVRNTYTVKTGGKTVGFLELATSQDRVIAVQVSKRYQRKGIATALYAYVENDLGVTIRPNAIQTPEGKAFSRSRMRDLSSRADLLSNDAAVAVAQALGGVLPQTLLKALAAGGDAGLRMLEKQLRAAAFNPDQPRDEGGQWASGGASDLSDREKTAVLDQLRDPGMANTRLRSENPLSDEQRAHVKAMDAVMRKAPRLENETKLYRAISYESLTEGQKSGLVSDGIKPGSTFTDRGFVSTSTDRKVVNDPGYVAPADRAVLHITAPKGTPALEPSKVVAGHEKASALAGWEKEVLLPRDTIFRIDKVDGRDIHVTVIKTRNLAAPVAALKMRFDAANEDAAKWAKKHAAKLIKDVSDTTRKRVRLAVEEFQEDGDWEFYHDRILAAVGDEERADLIARHESHAAASEGQRQSWEQAVEEGLLTGDERRVWIAVGDGVPPTCEVCDGLDGKKADLDGAYTFDGEEYDGPPAHVQCRCTEGIA